MGFFFRAFNHVFAGLSPAFPGSMSVHRSFWQLCSITTHHDAASRHLAPMYAAWSLDERCMAVRLHTLEEKTGLSLSDILNSKLLNTPLYIHCVHCCPVGRNHLEPVPCWKDHLEYLCMEDCMGTITKTGIWLAITKLYGWKETTIV